MPRSLTLLLLLSTTAFAKDRVATIRERRLPDLTALVQKAGLSYPLDEVYLRAFKKERVLEVWGGKKGQPLVKVTTFPFCAASGELGPKRREGDLQVPEGLYEVTEFNPSSNFHLSMKVGYPNASDTVRGEKGMLGGLIYLHGDCASVGCIAITDEPIEAVYVLARDAKLRPIRFDIFPSRLDQGVAEKLEPAVHRAFWKELEPAYTQFEARHRPAHFRVDGKSGAYRIDSEARAGR